MPNKDTTQVVCVAEFFAKRRQGGGTDRSDARFDEAHACRPWLHWLRADQRSDDPRGITYIEKWKDRKAFDEHCAMPYITGFFDNVQPALVDRFEVKLYEEILP